jgi:hypothetical protein
MENYNIPNSTLYDYIKSGKLYKNKYYFYNHLTYKTPQQGMAEFGKALTSGVRYPVFKSQFFDSREQPEY